jgi:hypothetical protein
MTKSIKSALMQAGATLAVALVATVLHKTGVISQDATTRVVMIAIGLVLAWQSNAIPKALPIRSARSQAYKRLSGWAFVLSGLAFAAAWAFAPIEMAATLSMAPVAVAMVTVFVVCLSNRIGSTSATD